jgi:hypothetical protein
MNATTPAPNLDTIFGVIGTTNRAATYSASDFLGYVNGTETLPTNQTMSSTPPPSTTTPPVANTNIPNLTASQTAQLSQLMTTAGAGFSTAYNADQWEYYASQGGSSDNLDAIFGAAGTPGRTTPMTAAQFVIAVDTGSDSNLGLSGLMAPPVYRSGVNWSRNPVARPQIPQSRWNTGMGASTPLRRLAYIPRRAPGWGFD